MFYLPHISEVKDDDDPTAPRSRRWQVLLEQMTTPEQQPALHQEKRARVSWLYGQWLKQEASGMAFLCYLRDRGIRCLIGS